VKASKVSVEHSAVAKKYGEESRQSLRRGEYGGVWRIVAKLVGGGLAAREGGGGGGI